LLEASIVKVATVGAGASNNDLGPVEESILLEAIVINDSSVKIDSVRESLKIGGDDGDSVFNVNCAPNL
jgi:hypothetical protein